MNSLMMLKENHGECLSMAYKILLMLLLANLTFANDLQIKSINRVYDGDTIYVDLMNEHPLLADDIGIRIKGIQAPEIRTKCKEEKRKAKQSRDFLQALLSSGNIKIINAERGKYFRLVADIEVNGKDIGEQMIRYNYALPYGEKYTFCNK